MKTFPQQAFVAEVTGTTGAPGRLVRATFLDGEIGSAIAGTAPNPIYAGGSAASTGFIAKLTQDLSQLYYSMPIPAMLQVNGLAVRQPSEIYAAGGEGGSEGDAVLVKLIDDVIQSQLLWHNTATGQLSAWALDAQGRVTSTQTLSAQCGSSTGCSQNWKVIGALDSNQDGVGDVLLYNASTGELQVWLLNNSGTVMGVQSLSRRCGSSDGCSPAWKPVGVGDLNHDGLQDVLWHNDATGQFQAWLLNGAQVTSTVTLSKVCGVKDGCWPQWQIIGIGDFNFDGIDDLFWYDTQSGRVNIAMLDGAGNYLRTQWLAKVCGPSDGCSLTWKPAGLADVNRDGTGDLLWKNVTTGEISAWLLNGTDRLQGTTTLSLRCDASTGCPADSLPVGILRNRLATP